MRGSRARDVRSSATWGKGGRGFITFLAVFALSLALAATATAGPGGDTTPPETTFTSAPAEGSYVVGYDGGATISFGANESANFQCAVDSGNFGDCSSGSSHTIPFWPYAAHTFQVRAIDRAGNVDPTPATVSFGTLPYLSTKTNPVGSLLYAAQQAPYETFRVIVQTESRSLANALANWANGDSSGGGKGSNKGGNKGGTKGAGQVKKVYTVINAVNAKLPGWAITYIDEHQADFGKTLFSKDRLVQGMSSGKGPLWAHSIRANRLWTHDAITCLTDPVTGVQLDPACVEQPAYTAPQAPAIAILDSGVDTTKAADFGARVVASVNVSSLATQFPTGDPEGHGTMVAGVAAGAAADVPGVAQNAPLVSVRVSDENGQMLTSDVIAGIDWVLANKAQYNIKVANLSLAGTYETSFRFDPLDRAVEKLWLAGVTVVAASGNHGTADGPVKMPHPGNDPFVITVGAVDLNSTADPGDDFRAPWSAYGHTADGFMKPELSAPGRMIVAPVPVSSLFTQRKPERIVAPGYMWMSGTSFAAPAVAGVAAQLLALNPSWTPDQVKGALMRSANNLQGDGTGVGEVDAARAAKLKNPPNPNKNLFAFVSTNAETGLREFDAEAWRNVVSTQADWSAADWTAADWTAADWTAADWTAADWTAADWTAADWTAADWTAADWTAADWTATGWAE